MPSSFWSQDFCGLSSTPQPISLRTLSIQLYACSHLKWNLCNTHPSSKFTVWLCAIFQRIHFRLFVCLSVFGDVAEVAFDRTYLQAVVACGNGWGVRIVPGTWRAVQRVTNLRPLLTSVNPFRNCKPRSFKHFGLLKDKTSPSAAISRKAGVEAICREDNCLQVVSVVLLKQREQRKNEFSPCSCKLRSTHSSKHTPIYRSHRPSNNMPPTRTM